MGGYGRALFKVPKVKVEKPRKEKQPADLPKSEKPWKDIEELAFGKKKDKNKS